jgi:hypothetical protein
MFTAPQFVPPVRLLVVLYIYLRGCALALVLCVACMPLSLFCVVCVVEGPFF